MICELDSSISSSTTNVALSLHDFDGYLILGNNTNPACKHNINYPLLNGVDGATGAFFPGNKPLICGGSLNNGSYLKECYVLGYSEVAAFMTEPRAFASSVVLTTQPAIWVIGGWNGKSRLQSTEVISHKGSNPGPSLPNALSKACVVTVETDQILILGGQTNSGYSKETYLYNMTDLSNPSYASGPEMTVQRSEMGCGLLSTQDTGEMMVIVAGGEDSKQSIETWHVNVYQSFKQNSQLPHDWYGGASVSVSIMNSVILVGNKMSTHNNHVLKIQCTSQKCTTEIIPQHLQSGRHATVAAGKTFKFCVSQK